MIRWIKGKIRQFVVRNRPRLDIQRMSDIADMVGFVEDFSEPSRTKFREKYAREILYLIREHEKKVVEWEEGKG